MVSSVRLESLTVALGYHGWLRVGTGLALLQGMIELDKRAEEIDVRKLGLVLALNDSHSPHSWFI
jgi:hypothetical protein